MPEFDDNVVVVTGAGRGIGAAIARSFAAAGAQVVIAEQDSALGESSAAAIRADGGAAQAYQVDVSVPASVEALFQAIANDYGQVDVLVNSTGSPRLDSFEALDAEDWQRSIDVLLSGVFFCSQAASKLMITRHSGAIINISSIGAPGGWSRRAAYEAAKGGVCSLTETLGAEWLPFGVRVVALALGATHSELGYQALAYGSADLGNDKRHAPLGRLVGGEEIARVVLFLASSRARALNACTIRVEGSWLP